MLDMQEYVRSIMDATTVELDQRGERVAEAMQGCTGADAIFILATITAQFLGQMDEDERGPFMAAVGIMTAAFQQVDAHYRRMN
jgi:hypothetical protein